MVKNGARKENSQSVSNLTSFAELSVKFTVGPHAYRGGPGNPGTGRQVGVTEASLGALGMPPPPVPLVSPG